MINKNFIAVFLLFITQLMMSPCNYADSTEFRSDIDYGEFFRMQEPLTTDQLARLSLISSGLNENQLNGYLKQLSVILKDSENSVSASMNSHEKAEALLLYLHNKIFKRYSLTQTYLHTVLDKGTFNCVSSAILYMILTRYHGIPVEGIHAVDHAFCHIPGLGEEGIDVETTNEWGFDPGSRKEFQSSFTNRTGYVYVPPGNYRDRIRLGDRDMAGLILQNRIVELQKKNRHMEALTLAADRFELTRSAMAREDYLNSVQNAAAQKNNQKKFLEGIELISKAALRDDQFPDFLRATRSQLVFNACAEAVNKNDLAGARRILSTQAPYILEKDKKEIETLITGRDLEIRARGEFSIALIDEIAEAASNGVLSRTRAASLAAYHYSLKSEVLSKEGSNKDAYLFMQEAAPWIQKDNEYKRLIRILRDNTAIEYHNEIVALLRQDNKEDALTVLNEGLNLIPGSSLLLQDKRRISP